MLTAKVLRAANSAHYGGNRKVGSVSDAVFLLGFNAVRTLILASGMTGAFKAPEFSRFAALINIAAYMVYENEKNDGATIVEHFPNDLATKLGINLVKLMERIDETKDLIGGFDDLLH